MEVDVTVGKLKNGKAASKDKISGEMMEVTGWWTGFRGCLIWLLRVVLCRKTGSLL